MSVRYDLTAVEILKLLGYTEPVGKDAILQAEQDKAVKLPHALFEFWSLAADRPLFETADIWTKKRDFFWFTYNDIQEWIGCEKKYWEKAPQKYASLADWKVIDNHLSDFLMRSICDVLCCGEYDTAVDVLKEMGWVSEEAYPEDFPALDMEALLKQKSEYGADAVCGCAYDEEKHLLIAVKVDRADSRNGRMMTYRKE